MPNQNFFVQPWFFSNGTSPLNADWTASNMLDPKVAETLQFLHDLIHVDKVSPIPGKDTMDNQFVAGQVAMINRGHWIIENAKRAKLDMDVANVPSKVNDNTVIGFGGYGVSKTSKHPDLAKALVGALTSEETQKEEGELGGGVPGRKSAAETPAFLAFPPSAALYYADAAAHHPGALARQLPGGREDLHALLHGDDGRRDLDRRRCQAHGPGAERLVQAARRPARQVGDAPPASGGRRPHGSRRRVTAREPRAMHAAAAARHAARAANAPQARAGYLFILPSFVALPRLRARAGRRHLRPELHLLRSAARARAGSASTTSRRFFTDDRSLQIFWNTLRFTLFAVTGNVCVGLLLALALNRPMPAVLLYFFRLAFFLPVIIAAAFVSIVWGYFYGDDLGVINYYLIRLGFSPGALADLQPHRHDVDRHHGRVEEHRLLHDHLHRRAAGRAEDDHRGRDHGRRLLLAPVLPHHPALDFAGRLLRHRLRLDRRAAGLSSRS